MKKTIKRVLSVFLTIVLLVTTFFIFDPEVVKIETHAATSTWDGGTSWVSGTDYNYTGGVYHILTARGLAHLVDNLPDKNTYSYALDVDLDLANRTWIRDGDYFKGTFDGQGHTIYNLYAPCGDTSDNRGLFEHVEGVIIKNLNFSHAYVGNDSGSGDSHWYGRYGIVAGFIHNGSRTNQFSNITITGGYVGGRRRLGGLLGSVEGTTTVSNCNVSCRVKG
ncbi:MAG: hypothetical protein IJU45_03860, partial [Clostridia bacterium]|nr:hypothetical protein [Clostridia bacterium]